MKESGIGSQIEHKSKMFAWISCKFGITSKNINLYVYNLKRRREEKNGITKYVVDEKAYHKHYGWIINKIRI